MGDISINLFLDTLRQLLTLDFTIEEKHELESLEEDIKSLSLKLERMEERIYKQPEEMNLMVQIRDVIFDAENAVDLFIVLVSQDADFAPLSLRELKDQLFLGLKPIKEGIRNLTARHVPDEVSFPISGAAVGSLDHSSTGSTRDSLGRNNRSNVLEGNVVVGFEDEVAKLIRKLEVDDVSLRIIEIVGPAGSGKTTLAREVYDHPWTLSTFEIRAWVEVSHDYNRTMCRDLLIGILKSAFPENHEDYEKSTEEMLEEKLYKCLQNKKYLIVMDNMWDNRAWNHIHTPFRMARMGCKVMFTCQQPIEPEYVYFVPHNLAPLTESCSWELLVKKVFGMKPCPPELVKIGKKITKKCDGLPLAIVTIAGVLATEDKIINVWEHIAQHMSSITAKGCMELLEVSYNHLPLYLKACFLYIGAHPEHYQISVRELTWLWITEGFAQKALVGGGPEAVAKYCLLQLIDRNLVMIGRRKSNGEIKTCRIHDLLREFCLEKAKKDNFFAQINGDDSSVPSTINKHRRLFISRQFFDNFFFSRRYPQNLRSFLCLGSRHSRIELYMSFFAETFKLLRVFSFIADECRGEILFGQLVHLRYLAVQLSQNVDFPVPLHLFNLETLIIQTSSLKDIELSSHIFNMVRLRNLYIKQGRFTCHVYHDEDEGYKLDSLRTLNRMCICEYCLRFLKRISELNKLGLIGDADREGDDVLMLLDLKFLRHLKILRVESVRMASTGLKLPSTLSQLSLKQTNLKWEELSIVLKNLVFLKVLKLLTGACSGSVWDTNEFYPLSNHVTYLKLDSLDIKEWNSSKFDFCRVEILVIRHCKELTAIPIHLLKHASFVN